MIPLLILFLEAIIFLMASLKIGTINVNGGGSPLRKIQIKQLVEVNGLDITLLQETHAVRSVQAQWQLFTDKECFFSNNSTSKAGIMFVFGKHFHPSCLKFMSIIDGHLASVTFSINQVKFTILNVYAPSKNDERISFFAELRKFLQTLDLQTCLIIGGDFNCTVNASCDRNGPEPQPCTAKLLENIIAKYNLHDIWRVQHPSDRSYTWCRCLNNHVSLARLDRIYVNSHLLHGVYKSDIVPSGFSDHSLARVFIQLSKPCPGSSHWKFNNSLLENLNFIQAFESFWTALLEQKLSCSVNPLIWWDLVKTQIKGFCQQYRFFLNKG